MEAGGIPMLNCLLQHTLRSLCSSLNSSCTTSYSPTPCKWVYAVFWRILPRNYPPPSWDYGGGVLDRSKGNKRNWILVWEDGFCDFCECERAGGGCINGKFGAEIFFKMSHEVYSYGEGIMGKVAADNSHKWIFREMPSENDPNFFTTWNGSFDSQPKAWESQFNSGIQTIVLIAVREGIIQLGSLDKMGEDLNLVISIQRKFSYLHSIPGVFAIQRPLSNIHSQTQQQKALRFYNQAGGDQNVYESKHQGVLFVDDDHKSRHFLKRYSSYGERVVVDHQESSHSGHSPPPNKAINLGWNNPRQTRGVFWSFPPLLTPMPCTLGSNLLSRLPTVASSNNCSKSNSPTATSPINASGPPSNINGPNTKMVARFKQGLGGGESFQQSGFITGAVRGACSDQKGIESKTKIQQSKNLGPSWEEPTLQLEFGCTKRAAKEGNPPHVV